MKRSPIYSRSAKTSRTGTPVPPAGPPSGTTASPAQAAPATPRVPDAATVAPALPRSRLHAFAARHERILLVASSVLLSMLLFLAFGGSQPQSPRLTQKDIDAAVMHTLDQTIVPSAESKAFAVIRQSVVRVSQVGAEKGTEKEKLRGIGTGVVVVDTGIILTNLHVVSGAERLKVRFANGHESEAVIIQEQPENDLAVLQAKDIPDDLVPATLRSTQDLNIGDKVIAVGFPFNIGPSVSSGIVSGLKRNYRAEEEEQVLANLIQFDAAANPGNSGGPLVTMDGHVVGIVTAILSPHDPGTFIGIGFAVPIETAAAAAGESPF